MHTIYIGQDLIESSIPGSLTRNPIALALDKYKGVRDVTVGQKIKFHWSSIDPEYIPQGYKEPNGNEYIEDYLRRNIKNEPIGTAMLMLNDDMTAIWIKEYNRKFKSIVLQFPVTKQMIKTGGKCDDNCPLALAVNTHPYCQNAYFNGGYISFYHDGDEIEQNTSQSVENFIYQNDKPDPPTLSQGMLYICPNGKNFFQEMDNKKLWLETKMLILRDKEVGEHYKKLKIVPENP